MILDIYWSDVVDQKFLIGLCNIWARLLLLLYITRYLSGSEFSQSVSLLG